MVLRNVSATCHLFISEMESTHQELMTVASVGSLEVLTTEDARNVVRAFDLMQEKRLPGGKFLPTDFTKLCQLIWTRMHFVWRQVSNLLRGDLVNVCASNYTVEDYCVREERCHLVSSCLP